MTFRPLFSQLPFGCCGPYHCPKSRKAKQSLVYHIVSEFDIALLCGRRPLLKVVWQMMLEKIHNGSLIKYWLSTSIIFRVTFCLYVLKYKMMHKFLGPTRNGFQVKFIRFWEVVFTEITQNNIFGKCYWIKKHELLTIQLTLQCSFSPSSKQL